MINDADYKNIALEISKEYQSTPDLLGIIWIGSASYGITDSYADIDIRLICDKDDKDFKMKQSHVQGIKIETDKIFSGWLSQKVDPDQEQFWIREKAQILYDPQNILKIKFTELNKFDENIYKNTLKRLYNDLFQSYNFQKTSKRQEKITSWMLAVKTFEALSKFCFIYHKKPVPTFKWRWYFIKKEKLLDSALIKKIELFNSNVDEQTFSLLESIEQKAQEMMLAQGYPEDFVKEPWLF